MPRRLCVETRSEPPGKEYIFTENASVFPLRCTYCVVVLYRWIAKCAVPCNLSPLPRDSPDPAHGVVLSQDPRGLLALQATIITITIHPVITT